MTEVYEGPQLQPPRISLINSADLITPTTERWYQAFDLILEGCGTPGVYAVCPPESHADKTFEGSGQTNTYHPYVIYGTDTCSTWPAQREFYDRAQRKLLANESKVLAEILWTGSYGGVDMTNGGTTNLGFVQASTPITLAGTHETWEALAIMDQELGECSGGRSMIHVRPQVLADLLYHDAIRREGNVYLSPMDNIVVADAGYPGTGPSNQAIGATEWMFGTTGIVQVRRGAIIRLGEDNLASQVSRFTNDRLVVAERVAHVALDTSCCVLSLAMKSLGSATH